VKEDIAYPKHAGIYKLTCVANNKIYIGKSVNLSRRLKEHKLSAEKNVATYFFQKVIIKYGWSSFIVEILEIDENFDKTKDSKALIEREAYYIELFDSTNRDKGYNVCKYSTDRTGIPRSTETKEKIRQGNLGKKLSFETRQKMGQSRKGRKVSEETKQKISQGRKGLCVSSETRQKISNSKLGKSLNLSEENRLKRRLPLSEETRKKMSQSRKGRIFSEESRQKMSQAKKGKPLSEQHKENLRKSKRKTTKIENNIYEIDETTINQTIYPGRKE
jgi:group I intron endonuclease